MVVVCISNIKIVYFSFSIVLSDSSAGFLCVENGESGGAFLGSQFIACIEVDSNSEWLDVTCAKRRKTIKRHQHCSNSLTSVAAVATGLGKLVQPSPQILSPMMVA